MHNMVCYSSLWYFIPRRGGGKLCQLQPVEVIRCQHSLYLQLLALYKNETSYSHLSDGYRRVMLHYSRSNITQKETAWIYTS